MPGPNIQNNSHTIRYMSFFAERGQNRTSSSTSAGAVLRNILNDANGARGSNEPVRLTKEQASLRETSNHGITEDLIAQIRYFLDLIKSVFRPVMQTYSSLRNFSRSAAPSSQASSTLSDESTPTFFFIPFINTLIKKLSVWLERVTNWQGHSQPEPTERSPLLDPTIARIAADVGNNMAEVRNEQAEISRTREEERARFREWARNRNQSEQPQFFIPRTLDSLRAQFKQLDTEIADLKKQFETLSLAQPGFLAFSALSLLVSTGAELSGRSEQLNRNLDNLQHRLQTDLAEHAPSFSSSIEEIRAQRVQHNENLNRLQEQSRSLHSLLFENTDEELHSSSTPPNDSIINSQGHSRIEQAHLSEESVGGSIQELIERAEILQRSLTHTIRQSNAANSLYLHVPVLPGQIHPLMALAFANMMRQILSERDESPATLSQREPQAKPLLERIEQIYLIKLAEDLIEELANESVKLDEQAKLHLGRRLTQYLKSSLHCSLKGEPVSFTKYAYSEFRQDAIEKIERKVSKAMQVDARIEHIAKHFAWKEYLDEAALDEAHTTYFKEIYAKAKAKAEKELPLLRKKEAEIERKREEAEFNEGEYLTAMDALREEYDISENEKIKALTKQYLTAFDSEEEDEELISNATSSRLTLTRFA